MEEILEKIKEVTVGTNLMDSISNSTLGVMKSYRGHYYILREIGTNRRFIKETILAVYLVVCGDFSII